MKIFDAHFYIISPQFALVANNGYLPPEFTVNDDRVATGNYKVSGEAVRTYN